VSAKIIYVNQKHSDLFACSVCGEESCCPIGEHCVYCPKCKRTNYSINRKKLLEAQNKGVSEVSKAPVDQSPTTKLGKDVYLLKHKVEALQKKFMEAMDELNLIKRLVHDFTDQDGHVSNHEAFADELQGIHEELLKLGVTGSKKEWWAEDAVWAANGLRELLEKKDKEITAAQMMTTDAQYQLNCHRDQAISNYRKYEDTSKIAIGWCIAFFITLVIAVVMGIAATNVFNDMRQEREILREQIQQPKKVELPTTFFYC
jgi:hypothetical protein